MLFDAHTHLNYEEYTESERTEIAEKIEASNVKYIIDAGDSIESSVRAIENSKKYVWCYAGVGIHPSGAGKASESDIERIRELAAENRLDEGLGKVVAIGEIGLDFYYGKDNIPEQEWLFREQIRIANELSFPMIIHSRDADGRTLEILKEEGAFSEARKNAFPERPDGKGGFAKETRVQLHCYSGSAELAEEYVRLGATISMGGPVTFKNSRKSPEVVKRIPIEFLLSETDAPFLAPEPKRGRPNISPYIEYTVRRIAILKGLEFEEAAGILTENGKRFFGIDD